MYTSPDGKYRRAVYRFPPSTAGTGVLSVRTHELVARLRERGIRFIIISVCA